MKLAMLPSINRNRFRIHRLIRGKLLYRSMRLSWWMNWGMCPLARWGPVPEKPVPFLSGLWRDWVNIFGSGSLIYPWNDGIMKIDAAEGRWDITGEHEGEGLMMTVAIVFPVRGTGRIPGIVQVSHRKAKKRTICLSEVLFLDTPISEMAHDGSSTEEKNSGPGLPGTQGLRILRSNAWILMS